MSMQRAFAPPSGLEMPPNELLENIYWHMDKEARCNFAHTCKSVRDAVLPLVTRLTLRLGGAWITLDNPCLKSLEGFPKGAHLKELTIIGTTTGLVDIMNRPRLLPFLCSVDKSPAAKRALQHVETLHLQDMEFGSPLDSGTFVAFSMRLLLPNMRALHLSNIRGGLSKELFDRLSPHGITTFILCNSITGKPSFFDACQLSAMSALTFLAFSNVDLSDVHGLQGLTSLKHLQLLESADASYVGRYRSLFGLASVLNACPLETLWVQRFDSLLDCKSDTLKYLGAWRLHPCESHGDAQDFLSRFPSLQELMLYGLWLGNDCSQDEAASRAECVHRSACFVADLAQRKSGMLDLGVLDIVGARSYTVDCHHKAAIAQQLLCALAPLSAVKDCVCCVERLGLVNLCLPRGVMRDLCAVFEDTSDGGNLEEIRFVDCCASTESMCEALDGLPLLQHISVTAYHAGTNGHCLDSMMRSLLEACVMVQSDSSFAPMSVECRIVGSKLLCKRMAWLAVFAAALAQGPPKIAFGVRSSRV